MILSLRNMSMILLYRPSTNKILKIIEGNFYNQHDVDILDGKRISIYNNNVTRSFFKRENNYNNIIIYNFETDKFTTHFENVFKDYNIDTNTGGLIDYLENGSAIVEDNNNGKIYYLNSNEEVIWKFTNLSSKNQIFPLWWARVISSEKSLKLRKIFNEENNEDKI